MSWGDLSENKQRRIKKWADAHKNGDRNI